MKKINISTQMHPNTFALVDDCDYDRLNKHKWHAVKDCYVFYAKLINEKGLDIDCAAITRHNNTW